MRQEYREEKGQESDDEERHRDTYRGGREKIQSRKTENESWSRESRLFFQQEEEEVV